MPQSLTDKRRNIASRAVEEATKLWDAITELKEIAEERAVAGNFEDADFDGTSLQHLTPFMIGSLLDTHVGAIYDFITDAATPARKQILLEVRK